MNNHIALDPQRSVVVEACAGSGKTWLLVSRIVRLLLAGVQPAEILAITFTRRAAQEMQARLHEWLHFLAVQDDDAVRNFLHERALSDIDHDLLARARGLYSDFLLAQPAITINTFHGWFMQIMQRAPLNAGVPVGMQLLERTSALHQEAWEAFLDGLNTSPDSETAQAMQWLFAEYGLYGARTLLKNFVDKRAEWWAYTSQLPSGGGVGGRGGEFAEHALRPLSGSGLPAGTRTASEGEVAWALEQLRNELEVDWHADPIAVACADATLQVAVHTFSQVLATGTETQCVHADKLQRAWEVADPQQRFTALSRALYTQADQPRSFKPTKKQDAEAFLLARDVLFGKLQAVRDALVERKILRLNQAVLGCGVALLQNFQELKLRQQQMDFTDLEWQVCRLLNQSDCADYMQYKLDSRYRHVLLDEFQDTNPLQWQILQAWFAAAAAVESSPTVFVVGDPKQSIYRFRRADARLFGVVREFLQQEFGAHYLTQNETRRNAPAVLRVVNDVFSSLPDGFVDFEEHVAHHQNLPGYVYVLPLAELPPHPQVGEGLQEALLLRNPLTEPRPEKENGTREREAEQFAACIADIVAHWSIQEESGTVRRAECRDIMVLVKKRTHLRVYEHALRDHHIPFLTSRRGGLLDTLEAEDIQALLTFLITPFANLQLAQVLRSPIFSCSDEDLMLLAGSSEQQAANADFSLSSWWLRLQRIAQDTAISAQLQRAIHLLHNWLHLADKLPVHDLLDRIYFEGDLMRRYAAALPVELHATVRANLQAFMEIALNVDAGRYPSLPRFLTELRELRAADDNEAPDEGRVGEVGNALRIYTVHEAKGLEAPIVWLLDTNDTHKKSDSYGVLLDWPPNAQQPNHFSMFSNKDEQGVKRQPYFEAEENYARREQMNLLYVAMTRAKQALLVSGNGELNENSWYARVAAVAQAGANPLLAAAGNEKNKPVFAVDEVDPAPSTGLRTGLGLAIPTGQRTPRATPEQRRGIWLHALLQHLVPSQALSGKAELQVRCGIPAEEMESLWQQAQHLLALPALQRFFDPQQYCAAFNEIPYVNAAGEMKRIDRLVEFEDEVWLLDYKTGGMVNLASHRAQMSGYRAAMQAIYSDKTICCALVLANGELVEI